MIVTFDADHVGNNHVSRNHVCGVCSAWPVCFHRRTCLTRVHSPAELSSQIDAFVCSDDTYLHVPIVYVYIYLLRTCALTSPVELHSKTVFQQPYLWLSKVNCYVCCKTQFRYLHMRLLLLCEHKFARASRLFTNTCRHPSSAACALTEMFLMLSVSL